MDFKTSNYGAARSILGFSEMVLWGGVGLGVIVAIVAGGAASRGFGSSGLLAAIPGISISIFCFVGVVLVQMAKATVDTADYSYQMLGVARDQLTVSKQALKQPDTATSYATRATTASAPTTNTTTDVAAAELQDGDDAPSFMKDEPNGPQIAELTNYRGEQIERTINGFSVLGHTFDTVELAKNYLDAQQLKISLTGANGSAR